MKYSYFLLLQAGPYFTSRWVDWNWRVICCGLALSAHRRRGFLKSQSLHHVNIAHLPLIHLNVLRKLHPQGNWAFFLLLLLLEVLSSVWNILFLTLETITCLQNNHRPGKEMFCICFYGWINIVPLSLSNTGSNTSTVYSIKTVFLSELK